MFQLVLPPGDIFILTGAWNSFLEGTKEMFGTLSATWELAV